MKGTHRIARVAAAIAAAVGAVVAFSLPAGADVGFLSPPLAAVQIGSPATLGARGATITVPVTVLCADGGSGDFLFLEVIEAVRGGNIASGATSTNSGPCTGNFQTVNVLIVAGNFAFRPGVAFARASFTVCDNTGCLNSSDQREIRIVR